MKREHWGSRIGFVFAAAGSAVGLANIWRFPFVVGENGGAAFVFLYLICLAFIGFPVLIAEILIGKHTQKNPSSAFAFIGQKKIWRYLGIMTIITGFIVSAFYSAVAGWILGYLIEALLGRITDFTSSQSSQAYFTLVVENPLWTLFFHFAFIFLCASLLFLGVKKGIEKWSKLLMPMLYLILIAMVVKGLWMRGGVKGLTFLLSPNWKALTPTAVIVALGQSFFTLSLGQGTMVTYGSYLNKKDRVIGSCIPVVIMDTLVALLAALAVFSFIFSYQGEFESGPGLIFHTFPLIFSQMQGGYFFALLFFFLVVIAALTSEISAMQPMIAYLEDEKGFTHKKAVIFSAAGAAIVGVPCALSSNVLKHMTVFGFTWLDFMNFISTSILIPIGGAVAVILVGWVMGFDQVKDKLKLKKNSLSYYYFWFSLKYSAPVLILLVFLHTLGMI